MIIGEYQDRAAKWCRDCFGDMTLEDKEERVLRLLEEAMELAQSLGASRLDALAAVEGVFARPKGEPSQELGGLMVVLSALAAAHGLDIEHQAVLELERIEQPHVMEMIRKKHAQKRRRKPLPPDYKHTGT